MTNITDADTLQTFGIVKHLESVLTYDMGGKKYTWRDSTCIHATFLNFKYKYYQVEVSISWGLVRASVCLPGKRKTV